MEEETRAREALEVAQARAPPGAPAPPAPRRPAPAPRAAAALLCKAAAAEGRYADTGVCYADTNVYETLRFRILK